MITPASTPLCILVVDDEKGIRDLLFHWLRQAGHSVQIANTGDCAVRLLKYTAFDLVITDIVMPDGDGFELIGAFRKLQPKAKILAISGGGKYLQGPECLKMARGLGAHGAVMKPFNWEQIHAGIEQLFPSAPSEIGSSA